MTVPAAPAAVRVAWAVLAPAWRAIIPVAKATFTAVEAASKSARTCNACIRSSVLRAEAVLLPRYWSCASGLDVRRGSAMDSEGTVSSYILLRSTPT